MQAGACTTALDGVNHSNWKDKMFSESSENTVGFKQSNEGVHDSMNHSNWNEKPLSESIENTDAFRVEEVASLEGKNDSTNLSKWNEPKPVKARKGGGDTNTTGKHSTRYNAYCKAVKTGKITPTVYGLTKHKIDGVGIGVETARGFLIEMEKAGVVSKADKGGKTMYVLA
jgi:hypothetical protein